MSGIFTLFPRESFRSWEDAKPIKKLGPFIGDQRLRLLRGPADASMADIKKHLVPEFFRTARTIQNDLEELTAAEQELLDLKLARSNDDGSAVSGVAASAKSNGFEWVDVEDGSGQTSLERQTNSRLHGNSVQEINSLQSQRENFLCDPARSRLCLIVESGTGKTIAMRQVQYLRGTNPGHLTIGFQFAEIPVPSDSASGLHIQFKNFLLGRLKSELSTMDERAVERTLNRAIRSGNLTLVIDALDQTKGKEAKAEKAKMLATFLNVESTHPSVACVVAGRPYSVTGEVWDELFVATSGRTNWCFTLIGDFDTSQQLRYISKDRWEALELIEVAALSQPRLLEAVRRLEPAQLKNIRAAAELHWLVLGDTFDVSNLGHDDNRKAVDWLLGLIAYTMHRHENYVGVDVDEFDNFLVKMQDQIRRLPKNRQRNKFFNEYDELAAAIAKLAERNVELDFSLLHESETSQVYFRSRTLQDFYAAFWLSHVHCDADDQFWLASVRRSRKHKEFWKLLTEMPPIGYGAITPKQQSVHWVRSIAVLFRPVGDETYPVRCSEWMYRAWWNLLLTSGLDDPSDPQPFFSASQPNEWEFNEAVSSLQKRVQGDFKEEGRGPDWNGELPGEASQAAKILLTDHLREFLAIKAGLLQVPGVENAVEQAEWFWEPSEKSGFVNIPKGKFRMGEDRSYRGIHKRGIETEHVAEISAPFELHRHPITEGVYRLFDPITSIDKGEFCPIYNATWYDSKVAATWLLGQLPTEQQWERACRGPELVPHAFFSCGDCEEQLKAIAWFCYSNHGVGPFPVLCEKNEKGPNKFGLYHMHGNVNEWTSSWYAAQAWMATQTENPWYRSQLRVFRGGSFFNIAEECRSAYRDCTLPQHSHPRLGFRVSRA